MNHIVVEDLAVRPGTLAELDRYADFWIAMFEEVGNIAETDMLRDWRTRFREYLEGRIQAGDAQFFVALGNGEIVGAAGALLADGYPFVVHGIKRGYIFGVRVEPSYRGRGVATRLTQEAVAFLRSIGCKRIRLHASRFGRPVYERLGFSPSNEMELV